LQLVTFCRTREALALLGHWQAQTLKQCSSDPRAREFGDQLYPDKLPVRWGAIVHVLEHRYRALAPWNADHAAALPAPQSPGFFHFHELRLLESRWI
jgi:hypothetical protein